MVKPERSFQRDLTYSKWHRTLPNHCYMIDLDSIEYRAGRGIVAFIETARGTTVVHRKKFQIAVLKELASLTKKPAYLVLYYANDETPTLFEVYDILNDRKIGSLTESEFRKFITIL